MQVILTEAIAKLGKIGDEVNVKDGFARNFLIPRSKALRATKGNREAFEQIRASMESVNNEKRNQAAKLSIKLEGFVIDLIRQAGDEGRLFGSVNARDMIILLKDQGFDGIERSQVIIAAPIKLLGVYNVTINLYADINATIHVNVARTENEAQEARKRIIEQKRNLLDKEEVVEV